VVEDALAARGAVFLADRIDVTDPTVRHPNVAECHIASVEEMPGAFSARYDVVFANYVFEHVAHPSAAATEIHRVLKPGGRAVITVPNPSAPEFWISAHTPLWFHRMVRGEESWHTEYAFQNIDELVSIFSKAGMQPISRYQSAVTYGYLGRFLGLASVARAYDGFVNKRGIERLMGDACLVFEAA